MRTVLVLVLALTLAACGDNMDPPAPDAGVIPDAFKVYPHADAEPDSNPHECDALIASLTPRPDLGSCSVSVFGDGHVASPGTCTPDTTPGLDICDGLYADASGQIGVVVMDGFQPCAFSVCATTPTGAP